jgi:thiol:disulfide interchange protein DsbA
MFRKILLLLFLLVNLPLVAAEKFQDNVNYFEIFPGYPGSEAGKIEVTEFFWYSCPHCFDFEPHLAQWLASKPADVNFIKVPVSFNATARFHAETYYALQMMAVAEEVHQKIFAAIHDKKRKLADVDAMADFLDEQGVDAQKYRQTIKSFAVQTRVNRAEEMARRFSITGVPAIVVNGAWRTGRTHDYQEMLTLVDFLINKARQEKVAPAQ